MCMHTHTHAHAHAHTHTNTYAHTHTCTCMLKHTHTHLHTLCVGQEQEWHKSADTLASSVAWFLGHMVSQTYGFLGMRFLRHMACQAHGFTVICCFCPGAPFSPFPSTLCPCVLHPDGHIVRWATHPHALLCTEPCPCPLPHALRISFLSLVNAQPHPTHDLPARRCACLCAPGGGGGSAGCRRGGRDQGAALRRAGNLPKKGHL